MLCVYLVISRPFNVLAVVSPVSGRTEPLGAEFSVENSAHFDAVFGVVNVRAIGIVLK
jgi:hypothetical protein